MSQTPRQTTLADQAGNRFGSNANGGIRALPMVIYDGAGSVISSFGGGTQYADGATQATPTGTAALWKDASNVLHVPSIANPFPTQLLAPGDNRVSVAIATGTPAAYASTNGAVPNGTTVLSTVGAGINTIDVYLGNEGSPTWTTATILQFQVQLVAGGNWLPIALQRTDVTGGANATSTRAPGPQRWGGYIGPVLNFRVNAVVNGAETGTVTITPSYSAAPAGAAPVYVVNPPPGSDNGDDMLHVLIQQADLEGKKRTYQAAIGAFAVSAAGVFFQFSGSAGTVCRIREIQILATAATAATPWTLQLKKYTSVGSGGGNSTTGATVAAGGAVTGSATAGMQPLDSTNATNAANLNFYGTIPTSPTAATAGLIDYRPIQNVPTNTSSPLALVFGPYSDHGEQALIARNNAEIWSLETIGAPANALTLAMRVIWTEE